MSKFTEELGSIGIINAYHYAHGFRQVAISYRPADKWNNSAWQVWSPDFTTDPKAHWQDYKKQTFNVFNRGDKPLKLQEAMDWAAEKYRVKAWAKSPFGDWMDAEFVKKRNAELRLQLNAVGGLGDRTRIEERP